MSVRNIERVISPPPVHMVGDGFRVHNFIPGVEGLSMQRMDPFIMMDYNSKHYFEPSFKPRGVGVHPHRGFETITIAYQGRIAHHDSFGNHGVIGEGEVQWMTAASGILHKEYHEEDFSRKGGYFQMVQLWLNLPAKDKMSAPKYQSISKENITKVQLNEGQGIVEIISGKFQNHRGPAESFTPVHILNLKLNKSGGTEFSFPSHYTTCLLVIEGSIKINEQQMAHQDQLILMKNDGDNFQIEALENSEVLVLSAEPIREPIAAHGPFVMNHRSQLLEAFTDYQDGKFGTLEE